LNTTPIVFAYPGDINTQSGGYGYDRRILREWERLGHPIKLEGVGDDYPRPTRSTRDAALTRLMKQPIGWPMIVDGLAFAAFGNRAAALADRHPLVALVHHPVGLETGLDRDTSRKLIADETAALAAAHRVIVTSPTTARTLTDKFGVATFKSTAYKGSADKGVLSGVLSFHGVDKPIDVEIEKVGEGKDPWGGYRAGFVGTYTMTRADFGVDQFDLGPASTTVELTFGIEGTKK